MKKVQRLLSAFFILLPFVFSLFFFGYFPPCYNVELHLQNIEGKGLCSAELVPPNIFAYMYEASANIGSSLKSLTIPGIHGDQQVLTLEFSGVSAAEITGCDVYFSRLRIGSYTGRQMLAKGTVTEGVNVSSDGRMVRFDFEDPAADNTIEFMGVRFLPGWFWVVYFAALLLLTAALAAALCWLLSRLGAERMPCILLCLATVLVTLLAGMIINGSLFFAKYPYFLLNSLILAGICLFLGGFIGLVPGTLVGTFATLLWAIANYYVIVFRSKPILLSDLSAIGTAREVVGGYQFTPTPRMLLGVAIWLGYALFLFLWHRKNRVTIPPKKRLIQRGVMIVLAAALLFACVHNPLFDSLDSFTWDANLLENFHSEGMLLSFAKSVFASRVTEPEGYSREAVDGYLAEYAAAEAPEGVRPVNIIMVMDEAFSDLRTVGLDPALDVMPFIDSLDDNTVEGSLYVSVYGGGTCNTEFEALTGNTLAFLAAGAYPYTKNVTEPLYSLASCFRALGYGTEAFHANEASNWNRDSVYPNLGFEAFHAIEDYEAFGEVSYLHDYPADITDYRYIEAVSADYAGQPRFLFNVTMQNHAGYERWLDVEKAGSVAENGSWLYVDTQVYLSLVQASDEAVRQLVETYRDSDEPTMIVYFGDHQPGLPTYAQIEIYKDVDSLLDYYKSKFFIWTNYETETAHDVEISANYLPWLILERGNFPLPPYVQMLREVHEKYPVISAMGVVDAEGNIYNSVNDLPDDPLIQKYRYIQYANLFDELDPAWFEAG